MNAREAFLTEELSRYLARYSAPRHLTDQAKRDEVAALTRAIVRHAPCHDYEPWWRSFVAELDSHAKTRAWPTVGEVTTAARNTPLPHPTISEPAYDGLSRYERLNRGKVADWLANKQHCDERLLTLERLMACGLSADEANRVRARTVIGIEPTGPSDPGCQCDGCRKRTIH